VKPQISAASTLRFDTLACGSEMLDTLTVTNTGTYPLTITSATIQNAVGGTFQVVSFPPSILPGASGQVIVNVSSSAQGPVLATLVLTSNDTDPGKSPWNVQLLAYRRRIAFTFNQDTLLTLPSVPINTPSNGCIIYRNSGDGDQKVESVQAFVGGDPSITLSSTIASTTVAASGLLSICFTATATDTGWHVRRFRVRTQPCDRDTAITVRFYARNPIIASPPTKTLSAALCESTKLDTIVISNTGNDALILQQPLLGGINASDFSILSPATWPDTIPIGGRRNVIVGFSPDATLGGRTATITFRNNDLYPNKNPWTVTLNGARESGRLDYNSRTLDLGDRCLNELPQSARIAVTNAGNAASHVKQIIPLDPSSGISILSSPAGRNISSGGADSILFAIAPLRPGIFTARYLVVYDPCDLHDTLTVTGRATEVDLAATPATFDFGSQPVGFNATRTVTLTNNGNVPATISSLKLSPPLPGATITDPTGAFTLGPGESRPVTVSLALADTGKITTTLVAIAASDCRDTLQAEVAAEGVRAAVFATRTSVDYGSIIACGTTPVRDTMSVMNLGTAPVTITGITLAGGISSRFTLTHKSTPQTLLPGELLHIDIDAGLGVSGAQNDVIIISTDDPQRPEIRIPLSSRIESVGLEIAGVGNTTSDTLAFATLYRCLESDVREFVLHNSGMAPDTISLSLLSQDFSLLTPGAIVLQPGGDTTVRIMASLSSPSSSTTELTITSHPCDIERSMMLHADYRLVAATLADLDFATVPLDQNPSLDALLENTGNADQRIERVYIDDPTSGFALTRSHDGDLLPAGTPLSIGVTYTPVSTGSVSAQLVVIIGSPCRDTLRATIRGVATDEHYLVTVAAGSARGRWGSTVSLPVGLENPSKAAIGSFDLTVTASPRLLDPLDVVLNRPEVTVTKVGYDPLTGELKLHLTAAQGASELASGDTLFSIVYNVLRGDEIGTDVEMKVSNLPSNVTAETRRGDFALEDYCDAYGRLLRVSGNVALEQNHPNPFNPETVIEFETAFAGHVTLVVYDAIGNVVARPIDEVLPAGRRRITFDARDLSSGIYTYRLTTGLQVMTRQMVVRK
jgi:hypothetical protein